MPLIALGKADNRRVNNAQIRLTNLVFEQDPTNTKDQVSFRARPGLALWKSPATNTIRGLFNFDFGANQGVLGVGGNLFFGYTVAGTPITGATGAIGGSARVTFAAIGNSADPKIAICSGTSLYSYAIPTSPTPLAFPDGASTTSIDALASRIVITRYASQQFYWTPPNTLTIDPLDFASAETTTDNLVGCSVIGDELWLFGARSTEVWVPAADPDLPYQRISGRQFSGGLLSLASLVKIGGALPMLIYVGAQERKVYQIAPNPQVISTPALEALLAMAVADDINAFGAEVDGHVYYVLNMGAQGTMAFDVTTGQWSEWTSGRLADFTGRYSAPLGDGRYLVGDTSGKLHTFSSMAYSDNGAPIQRRATGLLDAPARTRVDTLMLGCTVGQAATYPENPVVVMEFSDDMGKTWSDPETASLGHRGDFDTVPLWTRLGAVQGRDGRLFALSCAEDLPLTFHTLTYNERP